MMIKFIRRDDKMICGITYETNGIVTGSVSDGFMILLHYECQKSTKRELVKALTCCGSGSLPTYDDGDAIIVCDKEGNELLWAAKELPMDTAVAMLETEEDVTFATELTPERTALVKWSNNTLLAAVSVRGRLMWHKRVVANNAATAVAIIRSKMHKEHELHPLLDWVETQLD